MHVFVARAVKGKLDWGSVHNENRLSQYLKDHEGKTLRLEPVEAKRSLNQNRFLWLYYGIISRETGHSEQEIHEWAKRMFLPPKHIEVMGRTLKIPASTTELTKTELSEYMDRICAETNVPIPNPKDLEKLGYIMK